MLPIVCMCLYSVFIYQSLGGLVRACVCVLFLLRATLCDFEELFKNFKTFSLCNDFLHRAERFMFFLSRCRHADVQDFQTSTSVLFLVFPVSFLTQVSHAEASETPLTPITHISSHIQSSFLPSLFVILLNR